MKFVTRCFLMMFVFCILFGNLPQRILAATTIKKLLAKAKLGQTVRLPAGIFIEDIVVPEGVSLRGANVQKTIIVGSLELSATQQNPVSLSLVTVIHTGGNSSPAVFCKSGGISINHSFLTSEGGFATVEIGADANVVLRNNIIIGPVGDYAIFGRYRAEINIANNTIIVQGFGVGLMDKSFAAIRNCLFFGKAKPAIIRTGSDYSITYSNIALTGESFYFRYDLINGDIQLRDPSNYPNNPTPENLSNKDFSKYDSPGLTFSPYDFTKFKDIDEYRKNVPDFAVHAGSPNAEDNNADGSRNTLGAFGGPAGKW